ARFRSEQDLDLVEEDDESLLACSLVFRDLALQLPDPFRERPANRRAGEKGGRLDADHDGVFEARDVDVIRNPLREPTHDAGLSDSGPAYEASVAPLA